MPHEEEDASVAEPIEQSAEAERRRWRPWRLALAAIAGLLVLLVVIGWLARERIADDFLSGQLEQLGLPAQYEIESIGPDRQVLRNVVIGDPQKPDLTIERAVVATKLRFGLPGIGRITLERPRLFGVYRDGRLSFGSLDPLIFTGSEEPFRLPDYDIALIDGRGLLESEFGAVGFKLAGEGPLRGGFAGELAVSAPSLAGLGCAGHDATLYGELTVTDEKPRLRGPLRIGHLACEERALDIREAAARLDLTGDPRLDGGTGTIGLASGAVRFGENQARSLSGEAQVNYRNRALLARYDLAGIGLATPQAGLAALEIEGRVRTAGGFRRVEIEGSLDGEGLAVGKALDTVLADVETAGDGTLVEAAVGQMRGALRRESRGSTLSGGFILRKTGDVVSVVVPRGVLRGGSGATLFSLSRFQLRTDGQDEPRVSGNFATGGDGLPNIAGRMEGGPGGGLAMRVRMAEYSAGTARLALPDLTLVQEDGGAIGFAGRAIVSGDLPGGRAENLELPLDGRWSTAGLAIWRSCIELRFDRLEVANLSLDRRTLPVCPPRGRAIVSTGAGGVQVAAGAPKLDLAGRLGATPIRIRSGPIGLAWPGNLSARALDVSLGPVATASRFSIANLDARIGADVAGTFEGVDVRLDAVPLDVFDAAGNWQFKDGILSLRDASLRVEDREQVDRFQPLIARDATLSLADNRIEAEALLREPRSEREVVQTRIRHDLATGRGSADLLVNGVVFDRELQPQALTYLALGVIANAQGVVKGRGRIDWNETTVTSTGQFSTDDFDFAAAFGPVEGLAGTMRFTDLLGFVTEPDQQFVIRAINPGIEVNDGLLTFELRPGYVLAVKGAKWPFLDGTLTLDPVIMHIGEEETLRYTLRVEAMNAARFVERMELANLSATGTFDGTVPLVFDKDGGRIEGGSLQSRPPGGNVSYVGELTYEDLSAIANFAFDALRSLDYREMTIGMDGALEGEIITRVRFYGISQGEGTSSNFITRRIARLPIQFNVNVRAPFLQLVTSFKSLYDPSYVRDPRSLGLMDAQGQPVPRPDPNKLLPEAIQPPESEDLQ